MYLPQFHRVKENDEWWGEGFTEWRAVKKAEKLFPEHYQPRVPLGNRYYDLMEKDTMQWQADIMKQYGVDAQCFYHYWFKDGRRILEKPAENLLQWQDVDMPFCFCWANDAWARTWSKLSNKNVWANTFEEQKEENDSGILLEQNYGNEEQWRNHYIYLLSFFKDQRYIKIQNRPVFMIYSSTLIWCLNEMLDKWSRWARQDGFDGIYYIGVDNRCSEKEVFQAVLNLEPLYVRKIFDFKSSARKNFLRIDYDEAWSEMLKSQATSENMLYSALVGYDDTPRRGKEGTIIENATPEKFQQYLTELIAKNMANNNELIFINAWNEWGEGMHLEPDEKYGYGYLEAVKYAKEHYTEYLDKYKNMNQYKNDALQKEVEFWSAKSARYEGYWRILDAWLCLKEEHISVDTYFIDRGIYSIAIYGLGMLGKHLLNELDNSQLKIAYGIDRKSDALHMDMRIYTLDDELPEVDMIVVTTTYAYVDIVRQLQKKGCKNVVSLEEVIMELV